MLFLAILSTPRDEKYVSQTKVKNRQIVMSWPMKVKKCAKIAR